MLDGFQRDIDYLRISVTDRCNLRCVYCMPEQGVEWLAHEDMLSCEEIIRLARVFAKLGLRKIKITGGEPLVRKNLDRLVAGLSAIEGVEDVTLTTNGLLLEEQLPALLAAGLTAVNISLDTLNEETFQRLTRRLGVKRVLAAIDACLAVPGLRVKVNCVPAAPEAELLELAGLAKDRPLPVRFIELMPIGLGKGLKGRGEQELRELLEGAFGPLAPCEDRLGNGPCRYFSLPDFQGAIGFISAMSHQFCDQCNRVRLTASGFLKTCLQYEQGVQLRPLLAGSDEALAQAIAEAIRRKPLAHQFSKSRVDDGECHMMSQIGG